MAISMILSVNTGLPDCCVGAGETGTAIEGVSVGVSVGVGGGFGDGVGFGVDTSVGVVEGAGVSVGFCVGVSAGVGGVEEAAQASKLAANINVKIFSISDTMVLDILQYLFRI